MDDDAVREVLAAQHATAGRRVESLRRQLRDLADEQALTTHDDEHDPEGVTIGYQRAQVRGLLTGAEAELAALDRAEQRRREGHYGRCERCGTAIGGERLAALPATTRCIDCTRRPRRP